MSEQETKITEQEKLLDTVQQPAKSGSIDNAKIGDFTISNVTPGEITHLNPNATIENWREDVDSDEETIEATNIEEFNNEIIKKHNGKVAFTIPEYIWLPKYQIKDEGFKKYLENIDSSMMQYYTDNTIAHISVLCHERTHYQHYQQNPGTADTPLMSLEFSDITEQIANFNEYMTHAHLWKNAKRSGAKYIQIGEQKIKTDDILKYMPGLKEEVLKNGFDENDPECRQRIAKISSRYWNNKRSEIYAVQAQMSALQNKNFPLMGAIVNAREWEERKKLMVENLQTGDGATFSAPECLTYFEPFPKRIKELSNKLQQAVPDISLIANDDLLKLDKYMDKIGLKTDEEKEKYLAEQMIYISKRDAKADKDLEKLLLAVSSPTNQQITYADGITVKFDKEKVVISNGDIGLVTNTTDFFKQDDNLKQQLKFQKGEYTPDALNIETELIRIRNNRQMINSIDKEKNEPKTDVKTEVNTSPDITNVINAKQQNTL